MGRYLEILRREIEKCDRSDLSDIRPLRPDTFGRLNRLGRTLEVLERRCPSHIEPAEWERAVADGQRFLGTWGTQAERLGWTPRDVFGLAPVPEKPAASYRRLSRRDRTGLVWFLRGCSVIALTDTGASIRQRSGNITVYRRALLADPTDFAL